MYSVSILQFGIFFSYLHHRIKKIPFVHLGKKMLKSLIMRYFSRLRVSTFLDFVELGEKVVAYLSVIGFVLFPEATVHMLLMIVVYFFHVR